MTSKEKITNEDIKLQKEKDAVWAPYKHINLHSSYKNFDINIIKQMIELSKLLKIPNYSIIGTNMKQKQTVKKRLEIARLLIITKRTRDNLILTPEQIGEIKQNVLNMSNSYNPKNFMASETSFLYRLKNNIYNCFRISSSKSNSSVYRGYKPTYSSAVVETNNLPYSPLNMMKKKSKIIYFYI